MSIATQAALVASNHPQRDLLLYLYPKQQLQGWTKTGGYTYVYEIAWDYMPTMGTYGKTYRALQSVKQNGTALTLQTSVADVDANAGSYYYDSTAKKIYVRCTDDLAADRSGVYIVATFKLHFSSGLGLNKRGKIFNGVYYEPLFNAANLSAIESEQNDFLSGGMACGNLDIEIINSRRFFDSVWTAWSWKNAKVEILHGGESLPLTEYATIYTGYIQDEAWREDRVKFATVNWLDMLTRQIPVNPLFGDNVADDDSGQRIPLLFGRVTGIHPLCSNDATADATEWTVADPDYQRLAAIEAVYDDGVLVGAGYWTADLDNCKFTFSGYTPTGEVTCTAQGAVIGDIPGETSSDTTLMTNASDIIRFLLLGVLGLDSSQLDTAAFASSKANLSEYKLCKLVRAQKNMATYINQIESSVLGILYQTNAGLIAFDAFSPFYSADATLETQEIAGYEQTSPSEKLYTGVQVYYAPIPVTESAESSDSDSDGDAYSVAEGTNSRARYVDGEEASYKRIYSWLADESSATYLKQRVLYLTNISMIQLDLVVNGLKLMACKPSDVLKISKAIAPSASGSMADQYFQIISLSKELNAQQCSLVVDNFKGGSAQVGIWCSDSAPAWASATEEERATQGFWCDDDGLPSPGDFTTANRSVWW